MAKKKVALYLHIPFCIQKCHYCDFLSAPADEAAKTAYVETLFRECAYWKNRLCDYEVTSIFVGGGTPTSLSAQQLRLLQKAVSCLYKPDSSREVEFTVEMNPGTVTAEKIQILKEMGVNRVSVGLQSADDNELHRLGRIHSYADFLKTVELLHKASLTNFNVDIMAALPGQTIQSYQKTLHQVASVSPAHISAYSLILEEGTDFFSQAENGLLDLPDEDTEREMDVITEEYFTSLGYHRYEISNYAKPGKECVHNTTYWRMGEYVGIGLGASSYFEGARFQNNTDLSSYLREPPSKHEKERHIVTRKEQMEEFVFLGLRMTSGISRNEYRQRFGVDFDAQYHAVLPMFLKNNLLAENENRDRIYLTRRGRDVSNAVLAEFLLDEDE